MDSTCVCSPPASLSQNSLFKKFSHIFHSHLPTTKSTIARQVLQQQQLTVWSRNCVREDSLGPKESSSQQAQIILTSGRKIVLYCS